MSYTKSHATLMVSLRSNRRTTLKHDLRFGLSVTLRDAGSETREPSDRAEKVRQSRLGNRVGKPVIGGSHTIKFDDLHVVV